MKFMMQVYSVMNGIGSVLGGKGFKFINPFNKAKDKENLPKKKTREELLQDLEDIKKAFDKQVLFVMNSTYFFYLKRW